MMFSFKEGWRPLKYRFWIFFSIKIVPRDCIVAKKTFQSKFIFLYSVFTLLVFVSSPLSSFYIAEELKPNYYN